MGASAATALDAANSAGHPRVRGAMGIRRLPGQDGPDRLRLRPTGGVCTTAAPRGPVRATNRLAVPPSGTVAWSARDGRCMQAGSLGGPFQAGRGRAGGGWSSQKNCHRRASWGPETFELLRRLVHQVRQSSGFPPPEGYAEWDDDAAYGVITAMVTREGAGQQFVTSCFALAAYDASLERLFLASIKNFLLDEAKKTPRGKLWRRIARLMGTDGVLPPDTRAPGAVGAE